MSALLNILFPRSKNEILLEGQTPIDFQNKLSIQHANNIVALSSYKDMHIRAAIHLVKFHNHTHATQLLQALLRAHLTQLHDQKYILIPIPLSPKRLRERGYNQVALIAKKVCGELPHIEYQDDILERTKHSPPQTSLSKEKRVHNVTDAFTCTRTGSHILSNAHILVLDDVTTTGTTLREAAKALQTHKPASITCVALAH